MPAGRVTPYDRRRGAVGRYSGAVATYKRLTQAAAELTKQMKSRGIIPKTSLERKGIGLVGSRKGRKIPAVRSSAASELAGGDYSQFTQTSIRTGRKRKPNFKGLVKEVRQAKETTIYRYGGLRMGPSDYGYFWCNKSVDSGFDNMPLYMFDLTSVNNVVGGSTAWGTPFYRANMNISSPYNISWLQVTGTNQSGAPTTSWSDEKASSTSTLAVHPHEKSKLLWTDVRLNLFGAKAKPTKWVIQVVKLLDPALDPTLQSKWGTSGNEYQRHNAFYQGILKPYTFNPLALQAAGCMRGIKVLKTYTTIIQPTSTSESDADPHTRVLKWFMRWDRDLSYVERGNFLNYTDFNDVDYSQEVNQVSTTTTPRSKIWLMIRCTDYTVAQLSNDNTKHASFDMTIRACHVPN